MIVHGYVCARTQMQEMVTTGRLQDWLSSGTFTRLGRKPRLVCCGEKLGFPPAEAQWSFERRRAAGNGEHEFPVDTGLERRAPKSFKWGRGVDGVGIPGAWRSDSLECRVGSSLPPCMAPPAWPPRGPAWCDGESDGDLNSNAGFLRALQSPHPPVMGDGQWSWPSLGGFHGVAWDELSSSVFPEGSAKESAR